MNNPMIELSQRLHRINNDLKKMREKDDNNRKEIERLGEESLMVMMAITECYEMLLSVAPASIDELSGKGGVPFVSVMVLVYVNLIKKGVKTLEDVPEHLREAVAKQLKGDE